MKADQLSVMSLLITWDLQMSGGYRPSAKRLYLSYQCYLYTKLKSYVDRIKYFCCSEVNYNIKIFRYINYEV